MKSKALGVVVVRLQVPELHAGHRYLLNSVTAIHQNVLVVIGETEARLTPSDPLTFEMREAMLHGMYPKVHVARIKDQPSDQAWSEHLDLIIKMIDVEHGDPSAAPVLYGGRDSFLQHYTGSMRTFELPPVEPVSGTDVRAGVVPKDTTDFREGMIYASKHKFPVSYQCVDAAIMSGTKVLLGRKKIDGDKYCFVGGFVSPVDTCLEYAVQREVREETGVEPGSPTYIGSAQIEDYRYPKSGSDRLMTALFVVPFVFGPAVANDDLDEVKWVDLEDVGDYIADKHSVLYEMLYHHYYPKESSLGF